MNMRLPLGTGRLRTCYIVTVFCTLYLTAAQQDDSSTRPSGYCPTFYSLQFILLDIIVFALMSHSLFFYFVTSLLVFSLVSFFPFLVMVLLKYSSMLVLSYLALLCFADTVSLADRRSVAALLQQVPRDHFSSSIFSLLISVSHFGNSCNISKFFSIFIFGVVICDH